MPPLNYFVVESPDEVGRNAYERVAGDVLQDLDLIKVIDRLHIYVDPKVPIFVAVGLLRHMPRAIRVADFANVNRGEKEIVLDIGDETYLAPLLQKLWVIYGKENVDQPDRFTVVLPAGVAGDEDLDRLVVADPSETLYKDVIYALQYIAPEGFKVRRQYIREGKFYYVASEDTLPTDIVETAVVPLFEKMEVTL
ncbi:putative methanogenesis marker protein 17 [Methanoculleus chikugoensis]|jgi:putative methanogenesis marker protein 17|uniref:Putative methanogenesis marker protein 17 n=1 Tax=Methanoculleus chikugoensis TaxID=118126 RepID=A0A1M4MHY5_9EURY|nr:methanogenesis marker 17 protein [Methanoculleus chikugoensis]NMA11007.1 methanogenesis marker 17 protein [Methanomicrobiales archaeon]SCL74529.1 putative methanogenesis marker protein 17 [Methanoculleus chikugoensis]